MYLRVKFEVSSIILAGFRQGVGNFTPPPPSPSKRTPKKPTLIRVKFKQKITGLTGNHGSKVFKIMVLFKYLSNFWKTPQMPLINCKTNLVLTWSANCVISNVAVNQAITFAITDTRPYVLVATWSTNENGKLLQQLKSGFKRTTNWNKY